METDQLTKLLGTLFDAQGVDTAEALIVMMLGIEASRRSLTPLDEL